MGQCQLCPLGKTFPGGEGRGDAPPPPPPHGHRERNGTERGPSPLMVWVPKRGPVSSVIPPHASRASCTLVPSLAGITAGTKVVYRWRKRNWKQDRFVWLCSLCRTDGCLAREAVLWVSPKGGYLFSVASGHQLALVGEPIFKNKQPHQVIPRQEVRGWAPGTNLAKIIPVMRTNCLHTLSFKPYRHLLQLVPSCADEDQSFKD